MGNETANKVIEDFWIETIIFIITNLSSLPEGVIINA